MKCLILVVFSSDSQSLALDLVTSLAPLGGVLLHSYDRLDQTPTQPDIQVVVCIVTGKETCQLAHKLQHKLPEIPIIVVDQTNGYKIPNNGFADKVRSNLKDIGNSVSDVLNETVPHVDTDSDGVINYRRGSPRLPKTSPFDVTLARVGSGIGQTREAILLAATRHLSWELRADHCEAFLCDRMGVCSQVIGYYPDKNIPKTVQQRLTKLSRPILSDELNRRVDTPLANYLTQRDLNLISPMVMDGRLLGWVAFSVAAVSVTDDYLDDLHVLTQLLTLNIQGVPEREIRTLLTWQAALEAFGMGLLLLDADGKVLSIVGDISHTGTSVETGESFEQIRSSNIRAIIADALDGHFGSVTWEDTRKGGHRTAESKLLVDNTIAVYFGLRPQPPASGPLLSLDEILHSLPLPVQMDAASGAQGVMPTGKVSSDDSQAILKCAEKARDRKAPTLRLRYRPRNGESPTKAVLFFESSHPDPGSSNFQADIDAAVTFNIVHA